MLNGESGVSLGDGEDQMKAKGSTSNEPTETQYEQKGIDQQIIGNSTIILRTTEEGLVTRDYPKHNRVKSTPRLDPKVLFSEVVFKDKLSAEKS